MRFLTAFSDVPRIFAASSTVARIGVDMSAAVSLAYRVISWGVPGGVLETCWDMPLTLDHL